MRTHLLTKIQATIPAYEDLPAQPFEYEQSACGQHAKKMTTSVQDVDCELCKKTHSYHRAVMSKPIEVTNVETTKEGVVATGILPPELYDTFKIDLKDFSINQTRPWSRLAYHFGAEVMSENQARAMFGLNRVCAECGNTIAMMTQLGTNYCSANCQEQGES